MSLTQTLRMALKSLASSKLRSLLTMLGIIIGVASVIILVSVMQGMSNKMLAEFTKMGTNRLTVSLYGSMESSRSVKTEDMNRLYEEHRDLFTGFSPQVSVTASVTAGTRTFSSTRITGVSEQNLKVQGLNLNQGRSLAYMDMKERSKVCVIGAYLANEVFQGNAMGKEIKVNGDLYKVVGVLAKKASGKKGSDDDVLMMPYTRASELGGQATEFLYATKDSALNDQAKKVIEAYLYEIFHNLDSFYIMDNQAIIDSVNEMNNSMTRVLVGVAAISLLVGGIGIMNIMLVSVTERTREIGIRKSLGAKERDILKQFIIESAATSTVGGLLGIGIGIAGAFTAGFVMKMTVIPAMSAIIISFGISAAIGVFFGFMPANKAARMNPIDALKYD